MNKTVIRVVLAAAAAGALYWWLQRSGMWAQLFGGAVPANEFQDQGLLLKFCQANPTLTAVLVDQTGRHERTCAEWLAANNPAITSTTPPPAGDAVNPDLLAKLADAARRNPAIGGDTANVDQWNYLLNELDPAAVVTDLYAVGIRRGENDVMTARQYLSLRIRAGLGAVVPPPATFTSPMHWVQ